MYINIVDTKVVHPLVSTTVATPTPSWLGSSHQPHDHFVAPICFNGGSWNSIHIMAYQHGYAHARTQLLQLNNTIFSVII